MIRIENCTSAEFANQLYYWVKDFRGNDAKAYIQLSPDNLYSNSWFAPSHLYFPPSNYFVIIGNEAYEAHK